MFSTTEKEPWELSTDDLNRYLYLLSPSPQSRNVLASFATVMNRHLLSHHCPLAPDPLASVKVETAKKLSDRKNSQKLPERAALLELTRIVFQEMPKSHYDLVRFAALRVLILTGLRLNEVLLLPVDCLRWEAHVDVVTKKPAGEVGGVSRELGLRYFVSKRREGRPDALVESVQWIPQKFQNLISEAIELARRATAQLRAVLTVQCGSPQDYPGSDLRTFRTLDGKGLATSDLLFLVCRNHQGQLPASVAADARIGVASCLLIQGSIGAAKSIPAATLFDNYAKGDTKGMVVRPHSLRHLMNTEFFRLNVPDTVITHQFGRQTVVQSYEYDHRTLAERLRFVELPSAAARVIGKGTTQEQVAKMVVSGVAATSHIGQSFKRIQIEHGDDAAFRYLAANSDGFHVTPYGYCSNSFSVNPCARHLKCFDNCKHFAASGKQEHIVSLEDLRTKLQAMRAAAQAKPAVSVGRNNQIAHAERLLAGVQKALASQPSELIFPRGTDHSAQVKDVFK